MLGTEPEAHLAAGLAEADHPEERTAGLAADGPGELTARVPSARYMLYQESSRMRLGVRPRRGEELLEQRVAAVPCDALDIALERLAAISPRGAEVIQHRFFAGLTLEETAEVLRVSIKTVQRDWLAARAWLRKEVAGDLAREIETAAAPARQSE